ncbi:hypothetical protein M5K25_012148 [Dendrobium thyrsiflorum]|uniref:Uncharacterized protein n=1 Tax=Dendrobium thyrsiflorum TaxID=117978 RepID=A0ABD0UW94_DENTH
MPDHRLASDLHPATNGLSDIHWCNFPIGVSYNGLSDLRTHRQQSFQPSSPADYGPYNHLCRLQSFRPPSLDNSLSDLRHPLITVIPTSSTDNGLSNLRRPPTTVFPPPSPADYGPSDLHRQTTVRMKSLLRFEVMGDDSSEWIEGFSGAAALEANSCIGHEIQSTAS